MTRCPQCTKGLAELSRQCPYCKADLDLLVEYVGQLQTNLQQADQLAREGELGRAVWAYLSVLEVDPDNAEARRQVGQVATAVRQFDRSSPGRRWLARLRSDEEEEATANWLAHWVRYGFVVALLAIAFVLGLALGGHTWSSGETITPPAPKHNHSQSLSGS